MEPRNEIQTKIWESESLIRFPDCDPFNHLNNSRYIDYFINAREDHLLKYHHFNIYQLARERGISWVVSKNQIAYLRPATLMEKVVIQSTILKIGQKEIWVEMLMWNEDKTTPKALLWTHFTHFNLKTQRTETHSEELIKAFMPYENPPAETLTFDQRVEQIRGIGKRPLTPERAQDS